MAIHPRFQDQLPPLPDLLSPENVTTMIAALKERKKSFANRRSMFLYRKTTQYVQAQQRSIQRIESLHERRRIFVQRIKDRDDREKIERMSAHEKVAILIMFLQKDMAAQCKR